MQKKNTCLHFWNNEVKIAMLAGSLECGDRNEFAQFTAL